MEGTIAEIRMFAGNFAPRNWAFCAGQTMAIASNTALFSLLGTTYGGNGQTTFALPDLRGRVPVGTGQGPGLSYISLGEVAGAATHTLTSTEMPAHTHTATAPGAARNIEIYRNAARDAGLATSRIDDAISQCWVARTVVLAPTDREAHDVGLPYFHQMQTYRAAQSSAFEAAVAKQKNQSSLPVLCGSPDSMMEDFTSLAKTGIGGVIIRFRTGPMPADFSNRALQLFMREIAPEISRVSELASAVS